jgi:birA, biotin-[acetyl-CoA-carboxylase] ligase region
MNDKYNIVWFDALASTQSFMEENSNNLQQKEWNVVATSNQEQGRGQGKNKWESKKGKNLAFSLCLMPEFISVERQFVLTQLYSLGICDMLSNYIDEKTVKIKWPNDIYIGTNKICGMLVTNKIIGANICSSISGIGINVNQTEFSYAPNPTSIKIEREKKEDISIQEVLNLSLQSIDLRYQRLKKEGIDAYKNEYMQRLLYYNEWKKYQLLSGEEIEAKIIDVNEYGYLILQKRDVKVLSFELKEIKFLHR